jgi:hypothetical protein
MEIEGTISEILECWPPELVVETPLGRHPVALTEETQVHSARGAGSFRDLKPGVHARFTGQESPGAPSAMTARRIVLLPPPKHQD